MACLPWVPGCLGAVGLWISVLCRHNTCIDYMDACRSAFSLYIRSLVLEYRFLGSLPPAFPAVFPAPPGYSYNGFRSIYTVCFRYRFSIPFSLFSRFHGNFVFSLIDFLQIFVTVSCILFCAPAAHVFSIDTILLSFLCSCLEYLQCILVVILLFLLEFCVRVLPFYRFLYTTDGYRYRYHLGHRFWVYCSLPFCMPFRFYLHCFCTCLRCYRSGYRFIFCGVLPPVHNPACYRFAAVLCLLFLWVDGAF